MTDSIAALTSREAREVEVVSQEPYTRFSPCKLRFGAPFLPDIVIVPARADERRAETDGAMFYLYRETVAVLALALSAGLAGSIPALRASRINPLTALRSE